MKLFKMPLILKYMLIFSNQDLLVISPVFFEKDYTYMPETQYFHFDTAQIL